MQTGGYAIALRSPSRVFASDCVQDTVVLERMRAAALAAAHPNAAAVIAAEVIACGS